jgi:prolipoprotein diacylglyceryltransferase
MQSGRKISRIVIYAFAGCGALLDSWLGGSGIIGSIIGAVLGVIVWLKMQ